MSGQRTLTYDQINYIVGQYNSAMSNSLYGAYTYNNPSTQALWNAGQRWYTGVGDLEVVARCIYAECTYDELSNDRIGIAAAIMNRRVSWVLSARDVVTQYQQFSTVNPPYVSLNQTYWARIFKSKTNTAWQQATMLACIAIYSNATSDIGYFYSIPAGITSQKNFRGLDYVSTGYSNGIVYIDGYGRSNVAIAGGGVIDSQTKYDYMTSLVGSHRTVFFD